MGACRRTRSRLPQRHGRSGGQEERARCLDQAEALSLRLDARRRVEAIDLQLEELVLTHELVSARLEVVEVVTARGDRRRKSQIEQRGEKRRREHTGGEDEEARSQGERPLCAKRIERHAPARRAARPGLDGVAFRHGTRAARSALRLRTSNSPDPRGARRTTQRERADHEAIFSATRSTALRVRGLRSTSAASGRTGRRVTIRRPARCPQTQVGRWGGQMQSRDSRAMKVFTTRSSSEWNEMTARRPPGRRMRSAAASPCSRFSNSWFTAMRSAWNTRVDGSTLRGRFCLTPATNRPRSAAVSNGRVVRRRDTAAAMRLASGSSPYSAKIRASSRSFVPFTRSAAVSSSPGSALMSNGPSDRKLKPRESSASWIDERPRSKRTPSQPRKPCWPATSSQDAKLA